MRETGLLGQGLLEPNPKECAIDFDGRAAEEAGEAPSETGQEVEA